MASVSDARPPLLANADLAFYCMACLESILTGLSSPKLADELVAPVRGLFVTIEKLQRGAWQLRGCIGTLGASSSEYLGDYVRKSALEDRRFDPMSPGELKSCRIKVSILVAFETAAAWDDWDVGTHGITIVLPSSKFGLRRSLSATYLPQVMPEQGWTKAQAVQSLARKAGLGRKLEEKEFKLIQVERYYSSITSMEPDVYAKVKAATGGKLPAVVTAGFVDAALGLGSGVATPAVSK